MKLRTAEQLALTPSKRLPIGRILWKETCQVALPWPLAWASGRHRGHVYMTRPNGTVVVRRHVQARDPRTPWQLSKRAYLPEAQRHWSEISEKCRLDWGLWALRTIYAGDPHAPKINAAGYRAYTKVQFYSQGMGHLPVAAPPRTGIPAAVLSVEQVPPPNEGAFAFRIRHAARDVTGLRLLVELTPPMPTLTRAPRERDLVWFADDDPDAFLPLQPDGSLYVSRNPRFPVGSGRRFGLRVRIVTEEGVPGPPLRADLIKAAPEAKSERDPNPASAPLPPPPAPPLVPQSWTAPLPPDAPPQQATMDVDLRLPPPASSPPPPEESSG